MTDSLTAKPRLQERYRHTVAAELKKQLGVTHALALPRLVKVVVNVGIGKARDDAKVQERVTKFVASITGQQPVVRVARQSIAGFKSRAGMPVGISVTLRGKRMYDFLDKVVHVALPRIRDFRGLRSHSIDRTGNLTIGFPEQTVFPEISHESVETLHGLEVTIVSTARTHAEGMSLYSLLGFPFFPEEADIKVGKKRKRTQKRT